VTTPVSPPRFVVLFDIDGTLMRAGGAGRRAMERALGDWLGRPAAQTGVEMAGRTDLEIFRDVVRSLGLSYPSPPARRQLVRHYLLRLEEELASAPGVAPCPGVPSLLQSLHAADRWAVGLLTGNLEAGAWTKLRAVGLAPRFDFGAFGSDAENRNDLLAIAMKRVARRGWSTIGLPVVVGDTARDIECARAGGARVLAVRTGFAKPGELEAAAPDLIVDDLEDTPRILAALERLAGASL
jgi:phosphoglycolate phosphatase-like HAD superfamily hydrolase